MIKTMSTLADSQRLNRKSNASRLLRTLVATLLFLAAGSTLVQAQEGESCQTGIKIGFKGSVCGPSDVDVTLNGQVATADGVCSSDTWSDAPETFVTLKPDKKYQLTVGPDSCSTHISFSDIPKDYILEINGKEAKTIDKGGSTKGSGDGTWDVVLKQQCPCSGGGSGDPGSSSGPELGSIIWGVGLGTLSDGRRAGSISIREDFLTANIYTPLALLYSPPGNTTDVDVVLNVDGSLRQIKAPETLADIVIINSSEYDIRFYKPADVGAKANGIYPVSGQPFVTWKIKNPNPSSLTKMQILKIENSVTDTSEYVWDAAINSWSLSTGGGLRVESKTVAYPTANTRLETRLVKDSVGTLISKVAKTYQTFPWGDELIKEVIDPDSAALTTTYSYFENAAEPGRYRQFSSIVYPDGSWEKYDYDDERNLILVMRPWKDLALASATEANSRATRYVYTNFDGIETSLFAKLIFSIEETVAGLTVRRTTYTRTGTTVGGQPAVTEAQTVYASAAVSQTTSTTSYYSTAIALLASRTASIEQPDGEKETYVYEKGNYTINADPALNQFTPAANGLSERTTIIHGTASSPDGVAFKTVKEISISDQYGRGVLQETHVYTGSAYERTAWTVMDYDDRGHLIQVRRHNGEVATTTWDGDHKISDTDATGVMTTYAYDLLGRIQTQTKKGIAANGSFPAQTDIVTTYTYDVEGRQTGETVTSSGLSLTTTRAYDIVGRLKRETNSLGLVTGYAYTNGGRTQTVTDPGGATTVQDKYLDGQAKSTTGTAIVARYFDHGVNANSTRFTKEFIGSAGLSSPRWTRTSSDWAGRTVTIEKPSFTGTIVVQTSIYNTVGQLQKQTTMAGTNLLSADMLYEYDQLGRQIRLGADVDGNGSLALLSTDRVTDSDVVLEKVGLDWFRVTTTSTYLADNNATPTTRVRHERLTNFPVNGTEQTVSEDTETDVAGNNTRTTSTIDRAAKIQTTTTDTPDSNVNAVNVSRNGLLQSSSPTIPQTPTTFTYDSLGRRTGEIDSRTGTSSRSYSATTGQLTSTTDVSGITTYEYYLAGHVNAGRLKAQTNGAGKKVYLNYNSRGEQIQTWGDSSYPIEYVYDSYGQRTDMRTFRGGAGWGGSAWPTATVGTADVTKWIYQDSTGLQTQKQDAVLKGNVYTYDEMGRLKTRVSARLVTCTYGYDANTGELLTMTHSDSTPAVTFTYDRGGRQTNIIDAAGTRARSFNGAGGLQTEQITSGILGNVTLTVGYDSFLRRNSVQSAYLTTTLTSQTYGYDSSSRMGTIVSGSQTATYGYYSNSGLLNTTSFTGGTNIARSYDAFGRLQTITTTPTADAPQSYTYTYNSLNQRTRATREDGSYWSYLYNDRGELVSGRKYWSDSSNVWGAQTEYNFDNVGNAILARNGGNELGNLRQSSFTTNSLNQFSQRTVPGAVDVNGTAHTSATVTVNNQSTVRRGDYFYKELSVDNSAAPVYPQINIIGARNNFGAGGEDAVTEQGGRVYLPRTPESFTYDNDGNLTSDGRWNYTWDNGNRLASMDAVAGVPVEAKKKLEFTYDYAGRRIQKKTYVWNVPTSSYQLQSTRKFVYDGWNLIAELDSNSALITGYTWGQDLSLTLDGVGGIGGLLLINNSGNRYQTGYDGNGNVGSLVNAATGLLAASYDYDPFGITIKATGTFASQNPFRFSTKYADNETGLIYFGYRYYQPQTGKWLSRDPLAEESGPNLYRFNDNNPISFVDPLGLQVRSDRAWQRGDRDPRTGRLYGDEGTYDPSTPNWKYATGPMHHSYHRVQLCIPKLTNNEALDKIYEDLRQFKHFSSPVRNVSEFYRSGNTGHFSINGAAVAAGSWVAGNSIDIIVLERPSSRQVVGITIGNHPLVGVRKWWPSKAGDLFGTSGAIVDVETEAYEQASGFWNETLYSEIRSAQNTMWLTYLQNIAIYWKNNHKAKVVEWGKNVGPASGTNNPFRTELPAHLQNSRIIYR